MKAIEFFLRRSGFLGIISPKLLQEFVKGLPAEGEALDWIPFSITNNLGERCQIGERPVVQKVVPLLLIIDVLKRLVSDVVGRKKEVIDRDKRRMKLWTWTACCPIL